MVLALETPVPRSHLKRILEGSYTPPIFPSSLTKNLQSVSPRVSGCLLHLLVCAYAFLSMSLGAYLSLPVAILQSFHCFSPGLFVSVFQTCRRQWGWVGY